MCKMLFSVGLCVLDSRSGKIANLCIFKQDMVLFLELLGCQLHRPYLINVKLRVTQRQWGPKPKDGSIGNDATHVVPGTSLAGRDIRAKWQGGRWVLTKILLILR